MGKNTLSTTQLAHQIIADLKPLSEMLPPGKRRIVEKFFEYILQERVAIGNASDLIPLEAALIVILLEEHRANQHEHNELYSQLQELRRVVEELKPRT
jgi:hypothetical protein